jgi:chromosome segregation ATPase
MIDLLRAEMERKIEELKKTLETLLASEVDDIKSHWSAELETVRMELTLRIESLEGEKEKLERMLDALERQREGERKSLEKALAESRMDAEEAREEKSSLISKWKSLLDTKTLLQTELTVYDVLVQMEEKR